MNLLIKNGRVIDPYNKIDDYIDVLVIDGKISKLSKNITLKDEAKKIASGKLSDTKKIDASGKLVCPGFIDIHTHLREPGREDEETIRTGTLAAAHGGFTSIACMPNTDPVNDNKAVTDYIISKAKKEGFVNVFPVGSITKKQEGEQLSEIGELAEAGCVALSDDGKSVHNSELLRRAMEYAKMFSLPIMSHCEDERLSENGVMNEGFVATELGMKGIPDIAEDIIVARDIMLSRMTGMHLHLTHISTAGSVALVRQAKSLGFKVTADVAIHHLILTDDAIRSFDTNYKMKPPLRTQKDIDALIKGLQDGTIDAIVSDHAPHLLAEKDVEFKNAPFGIIGLETEVSLALSLVNKKLLDLKTLIICFTVNPAKILSLDKGTLSVGKDADITILDLEKEYKVDAREFKSISKNSPFIGWNFRGKPVMTIVGGKIVTEPD
ncbi:MAG: dihydroorotase [Candidatus Schekmanbacteria bacterium RIFCSPHIGHO2_02_FULL_38_11]|uniref:Dihydroorotase n=1 Tax=Candidatus Schekmanbacteria bacterium RIFCSPLOWO2_12_FULL_38_15 TaxID=1817883 RepID=A0A1F7SNC5_9BACT|nr:MAG: dihydroorotase [Candidatus Schekmanbacteria bacterium GWA2_38_9]OGL48398.1 MAG: dihydroorotase [Candidatus Schekmanbacteria bacterium RIFCSPLOWO2_02_FULL_38_14]OGL51992.1 MAG: dihydroorotase [Candidatus Schekmanbacteria bacterium RIFCSPHIGHO2_02_FULL_38_11]OGL55281.1 MAG: dihydroorotase [Candidatus Schekmanbacteria bacterium RIFCSPLOWO2_12_FULL_38_15]